MSTTATRTDCPVDLDALATLAEEVATETDELDDIRLAVERGDKTAEDDTYLASVFVSVNGNEREHEIDIPVSLTISEYDVGFDAVDTSETMRKARAVRDGLEALAAWVEETEAAAAPTLSPAEHIAAALDHYRYHADPSHPAQAVAAVLDAAAVMVAAFDRLDAALAAATPKEAPTTDPGAALDPGAVYDAIDAGEYDTLTGGPLRPGDLVPGIGLVLALDPDGLISWGADNRSGVGGTRNGTTDGYADTHSWTFYRPRLAAPAATDDDTPAQEAPTFDPPADVTL